MDVQFPQYSVRRSAVCFCIIYIQKKSTNSSAWEEMAGFLMPGFEKTIAYGWASAMQQATVQMGKNRNTGTG